MSSLTDTRDGAIFYILALELLEEDPKLAHAKIKRTLRRKKLGDYDQDHVDELRRLRDALKGEFHKFDRSIYYRGTPGQFALPENWDYERMLRDFSAAFPTIAEPVMGGIINYALYAYYLR